MRLRWSARARRDLISIGHYVSQGGQHTARRFVQKLVNRARLAARFPRAGRVVPEFELPWLREAIVGNYRIIYRIDRGSVYVLTVFEGHRLLRRQDVGEPPLPDDAHEDR